MNLTFLLFRLLVKLSWKLSSFFKLIRGHGRLLDIATSAISSCIEDVAGDGSNVEDWEDLDYLISSFLSRWTFPRSTLACEYHQPYLRIIFKCVLANIPKSTSILILMIIMHQIPRQATIIYLLLEVRRRELVEKDYYSC